MGLHHKRCPVWNAGGDKAVGLCQGGSCGILGAALGSMRRSVRATQPWWGGNRLRAVDSPGRWRPSDQQSRDCRADHGTEPGRIKVTSGDWGRRLLRAPPATSSAASGTSHGSGHKGRVRPLLPCALGLVLAGLPLRPLAGRSPASVPGLVLPSPAAPWADSGRLHVEVLGTSRVPPQTSHLPLRMQK